MVQNLYKRGLINVSIPQKAKCFNAPNLYTTNPHFYNSLKEIGSISFLSSSDSHQSHYLLGCHTIDINSLLISFLSALLFSNLVCQTKSLT